MSRELSLELFDGLRGEHRLSLEARELLQYAALLHDVGAAIGYDGHHEHSAYVIRHGNLRGLSAEEVGVVALVARYHGKAQPRKRDAEFRALAGIRAAHGALAGGAAAHRRGARPQPLPADPLGSRHPARRAGGNSRGGAPRGAARVVGGAAAGGPARRTAGPRRERDARALGVPPFARRARDASSTRRSGPNSRHAADRSRFSAAIRRAAQRASIARPRARQRRSQPASRSESSSASRIRPSLRCAAISGASANGAGEAVTTSQLSSA